MGKVPEELVHYWRGNQNKDEFDYLIAIENYYRNYGTCTEILNAGTEVAIETVITDGKKCIVDENGMPPRVVLHPKNSISEAARELTNSQYNGTYKKEDLNMWYVRKEETDDKTTYVMPYKLEVIKLEKEYNSDSLYDVMTRIQDVGKQLDI